MTKITMTIGFGSEDGETRQETHTVEARIQSSPDGEHYLAHSLLAELRAGVGEQPTRSHNVVANEWLNFPSRPVRFDRYFDITNSRSVWFELTNLVMAVENYLAVAQAFKLLEPAHEPPFDNAVAISDLHYIHDRKLTSLNLAVYGLIKMVDLVHRLLHESMGGTLVDTSKRNWEKSQLNRRKVKMGLKTKLAAGLISQSDFDAITAALRIPSAARKSALVREYRNRLVHNVSPAVDYPMFFWPIESRLGQSIRGERGKVIGSKHALFSKRPVEYQFRDLHAAFSGYLSAVVSMLQMLSRIEMLHN